LASVGGGGHTASLLGGSNIAAAAAQYPPSKVTICHHTHSQKNPFVTIIVSERALPAHLGHGDTVGPCPQQSLTPEQGDKPAKQHGKAQHHSTGCSRARRRAMPMLTRARLWEARSKATEVKAMSRARPRAKAKP